MGSNKHSNEHIQDIFFRAQNISAGEGREEFLKQACGDDANLRKDVESLLNAYECTRDFLSHDASGEALTDCPDQIGQTIGPYRILARLGEGGFGEVFLAEQLEPFRREVALKIIKLGMDTKQVIARFDAERQALALMDHPNIAHAYDAGATESGRPYFVMELIRGEPFIKYCDQHRLSLADRLQLFQQVCDAVQHAHQKGIIHRDLKPSNIIVSEENGKPLPKVIDFGIAKSLEGRLTEQTLATLQEMMVGTPKYMSPEQLAKDVADVDVRTDVYSLGLILYELVAGATPLANETPCSMAEMRQAMETAELPCPSRLLRTLGDETTAIAHVRQTKLPALAKLLQGDLDWVVMKAIEQERDRRYDDVDTLSRDLERYLNHEPVSVGPPSLIYRCRKFFRRHRMATVVAASVGGSLLLGASVATIGFLQIKAASPASPEELVQKGLSSADVHVPGWELNPFCSLGNVDADRFGLRPDGSVLVVGKGRLYWLKEGESCTTTNIISSGRFYGRPGAVLELPEGVYVASNNRIANERLVQITGHVLLVPPEGGESVVFREQPIRNPVELLAVPESFDGPNVDPGDLLVFDNDHRGPTRTAIWTVHKTKGTTRLLIVGNPLNEGFLNGSFSPDGNLYAGLTDRDTSGVSILQVFPDGGTEVVLNNFKFTDGNKNYKVNIAVHPVTGEVFFCARESTYAFFPGKTSPRLVIAKGDALQWTPDGSKLYILANHAIWTLSGPDIATRPVSTRD